VTANRVIAAVLVTVLVLFLVVIVLSYNVEMG
jgi:hypothetical protein